MSVAGMSGRLFKDIMLFTTSGDLFEGKEGSFCQNLGPKGVSVVLRKRPPSDPLPQDTFFFVCFTLIDHKPVVRLPIFPNFSLSLTSGLRLNFYHGERDWWMRFPDHAAADLARLCEAVAVARSRSLGPLVQGPEGPYYKPWRPLLILQDTVLGKKPQAHTGDTVRVRYDILLPAPEYPRGKLHKFASGKTSRWKLGSGKKPASLEAAVLGIRLFGRRLLVIPELSPEEITQWGKNSLQPNQTYLLRVECTLVESNRGRPAFSEDEQNEDSLNDADYDRSRDPSPARGSRPSKRGGKGNNNGSNSQRRRRYSSVSTSDHDHDDDAGGNSRGKDPKSQKNSMSSRDTQHRKPRTRSRSRGHKRGDRGRADRRGRSRSSRSRSYSASSPYSSSRSRSRSHSRSWSRSRSPSMNRNRSPSRNRDAPRASMDPEGQDKQHQEHQPSEYQPLVEITLPLEQQMLMRLELFYARYAPEKLLEPEKAFLQQVVRHYLAQPQPEALFELLYDRYQVPLELRNREFGGSAAIITSAATSGTHEERCSHSDDDSDDEGEDAKTLGAQEAEQQQIQVNPHHSQPQTQSQPQSQLESRAPATLEELWRLLDLPQEALMALQREQFGLADLRLLSPQELAMFLPAMGPRKRLDAFLRRSADTSTSNSNDVIGDSAAAVVPRAPSGGVEVLPQIPTQQVQLDSIAPSNSNSAQPEEKEENGGSGGGADNKTTSLRLDPADALFGKFDRNSFLRIREELRSPAGAGGDRQPPQQLPEQMTALQRFEEELLKLSLGQILGEAGGAAAAAPLTSSPAAGANSAFSTDGGPAAVAEAHVVAQRGGWDLLEKDGDPREVPQPLAKKLFNSLFQRLNARFDPVDVYDGSQLHAALQEEVGAILEAAEEHFRGQLSIVNVRAMLGKCGNYIQSRVSKHDVFDGTEIQQLLKTHMHSFLAQFWLQ